MTGESREITGTRPSLVGRARTADEVGEEVKRAVEDAYLRSTRILTGPAETKVPISYGRKNRVIRTG